MTQQKESTRQQLYDLVWSTPMTKLAKTLVMSDVGLRKICVKHDIPTPPLGYWAKLNFGKPVKQPPLPLPSKDVADRFLVSVYATVELPEHVRQAAALARETVTEILSVPIEMPTRLHQFAKSLKAALKSGASDRQGFLNVGGAGVISASVGKSSATRVVLIAGTLLKALEGLGHHAIPADDGLDLIVEGERMRFLFSETKDKREHLPTKSELKARDDWEASRVRYPSIYNADRRHWPSWDHYPSGRISLTLIDPLRNPWQDYRILGSWRDRQSTSLENYVNDIFVAILAGAALVRHNRLAAEATERRKKEAHEARLFEQERLRKQKQVDDFIGQKADAYVRLTNLIAFRDYLSNTATSSSTVRQAAEDLITRIKSGLSVSNLDEEIIELNHEPENLVS